MVFKTSDLRYTIEKIITNGETSAIGYSILKTWLWYNYLIDFEKPTWALPA